MIRRLLLQYLAAERRLAFSVFGLTFENIKGVALSRYFDDSGERVASMTQINVFYLIVSIRNSRNN